MPAEKKIRRPLHRWARRLVRSVLWTGILAVALLAGVLWLLQQPFSREWIQQRLNEQVVGEVTFASVGLSWNGALKLNEVEYALEPGGASYQFNAQSLQLDDLLFGRPHLYLRNVGTSLGYDSVLSASRGVVAWPEPISGAPFAITVHQADLDFFPLLKSFNQLPASATSSASS